MDTLLRQVDDLCAEIYQNTTLINCGGCCVFAGLLGKKLEQYGEVRIRIVKSRYDDYPKSINSVKGNVRDPNNLSEWHENNITFWHVIVEFKYKGQTFHIDSTGVFEAKKGKSELSKQGDGLLAGWFSVEQANRFANAGYGWNWMFDRSQIPYMEKTIEDYPLAA